MAKCEITTVAPGVTRDDSDWGYTLKGTKGALLTSGLAKEEWFYDGRRGKDGRRLTTVYFKVDGNRARCSRRSHWAEGEYIINVEYPKEEARKRRKAQAQERAPHEAKNLLEFGVVNTIRAFNVENNPEWPWQFPAETIEQVRSHLREVMRLFESGFKVRPGQPPEGNAEFQRFMQRATNAAG